MIRWRRVAGAILAASWLLPSHLHAQAPEPARLGEIVVSADAPVSELAGTTRRVTADDIEAYGARTLDEAIALLPGVYVRTGADGTPRVDLRGFRTRQVVLLVDGVPYNATSDGQFDPTLIPVERIAEIKLATGAGSVLYGAGGLAGTINIVTREGRGPAAATVRGEWRDGAAWLGRATGSVRSRGVRAFAGASRATTEGFPTPSGSSRLRLNSDRERRNAAGHLGLDLGNHGTIGLTLESVAAAFGAPPSVIDDPGDPFANRPVYERVNRLDGFAAQVAGAYAPVARWWVRGWAYRNLIHQETDRFADARFDPVTLLAQPSTSRDRSRTLLRGATGQAGASFGRAGRLTLALSAERSSWEQVVSEAVAGGGGGGGAGGGGGGGGGGGSGGGSGTGGDPAGGVTIVSSGLDRALWQYGAALEYEVRPTDHIGLVGGTVYRRLEGEGLGDAAAGVALGAYLEPTSAARVRVAYARRFRFPTLRQLFEAAGGNPGLATEKADAYEAGVEYTPGAGSSIAMTLFRSDARDFIERPQGGTRYQNAERYRFHGIEMEVIVRSLAGWLARARYTLLDAKDRSAGREGLRLQYRPRHTLAAELRHSSPAGFSASGTLRYVADQAFESRREPSIQADLPDFALVGFRVEQAIPGTPVAAYLGVDNLLDQNYEESYGFPQPGRVAYLGLDLEP